MKVVTIKDGSNEFLKNIISYKFLSRLKLFIGSHYNEGVAN